MLKGTKSPRLVVSALIKKKNKFLLIKEKLENNEETWIIPGGGVDFGENLEQAVKREIKEELGIDIKIIDFIKFHEAIFTKFNYHTVIFFYLVKALNEDFKLEKKILDARFFSQKQMKKIQLVDSAQWLITEKF